MTSYANYPTQVHNCHETKLQAKHEAKTVRTRKGPNIVDTPNTAALGTGKNGGIGKRQ